MMLILKKSLSFLLAVIFILGVFPVTIFAQEIKDGFDDTLALVWDSKNVDKSAYFSDMDLLWESFKWADSVLMMNDWDIDEVLIIDDDMNISIYMNGYDIDRGLSSAKGSGEVFLVRENATLSLYGSDGADTAVYASGSKITGGYNSNGGGGIHIQEKGRVFLYGVSVTGNRSSDKHGGGGVRLQGDNSYLFMDKYASISDNTALNGSGGGIAIRGENASVCGGTISNNKARDNGGGISVYSNGCSISEAKIKGNVSGAGSIDDDAKGDGGGIYMAKGCGASVSGCTIEENKAENGRGGGICVDGNGGSLSHSIIQKNTSSGHGGGVYIDDGDSLSISGSLKIKDNVSSKGAHSGNMFLEFTDGDSRAYIEGSVSSGEVHIGWNTDNNSQKSIKLTTKKGTYDSRFFVSDVPGYHIYWSWMTEDEKNDRVLRASTTEYKNHVDHTTTEVDFNNRYHVIENGYLGKYDLQEGIYTYRGFTGENIDGVYYYSDGYFVDDPKVYNTHLATMTFALAMSGFNPNLTEFDKGFELGAYANMARNAKLLLSDIGFLDDDIYINDYFTVMPTDSSIGVVIGAKTLELNNEEGKPYILMPVIVRGAGYGAEWISNVTLGHSSEAEGFSKAATHVVDCIEEYLQSDLSIDVKTAIEEGRVKFWVTGFSRGGAVANLVSKRVTDTYGPEGNKIYAYTYEAPRAGDSFNIRLPYDWNYNGQYSNIHNIINTNDFVTYVGPEEMGFVRYGVDHYVPGTDAGSVEKHTYKTNMGSINTTFTDNKSYIVGSDEYNERRERMLYQLALLNDNIIFDDYFCLATMNYLGSVAGSDLIGELENGTKTTAEKWMRSCMKDLLRWAANGTYSWSTVDGSDFGHNYREFFANNKKFCGTDYTSVEEALKVFIYLLYGQPNKDEFKKAMTYRLGKFMGDQSMKIDFYIGVITMWDEQAQYRQRWYINDVWNILTKDMTYPDGSAVPKITDYVEEEEQANFKKSTYALCAFLFLFICKDYDNTPNLSGADTSQVHLGTLLYNASTILKSHTPEICMAWLRTYDSHYSEDNGIDGIRYNGTEVDLVYGENAAPKEVEADIEVMQDTSTITLSTLIGEDAGVDSNSRNNGSIIYYQIYKNGKAMDDWSIYMDPIVLDISDDSVEYEIKTFALRCEEETEVKTITNKMITGRDSTLGSLISDGSSVIILASSAIMLIAAIVVFIYSKKKRVS